MSAAVGEDDVAGGGGQRPPQRFTLAGQRRNLGQNILAANDPGSGGERACRGVVGGAGVQHDQFVDQAAEHRRDGVDHRPDGLGLVQRGQHDRDGAAALRGDEVVGRPHRPVPAVAGEPGVVGFSFEGHTSISAGSPPLST